MSIREADVTEIIRTHRSKFDAILLDVDNGPEGLTRKANDALYSSAGLNAAHAALRPGGVLAVWSSGPNPAFAKRLRGAGFDVNEVNIRATGRGGGARHVIWIAKRDEEEGRLTQCNYAAFAAARCACSSIAPMICGHIGIGSAWPMPSIISSFAPGIEAAVSLPPSGRTSGSTVP